VHEAVPPWRCRPPGWFDVIYCDFRDGLRELPRLCHQQRGDEDISAVPVEPERRIEDSAVQLDEWRSEITLSRRYVAGQEKKMRSPQILWYCAAMPNNPVGAKLKRVMVDISIPAHQTMRFAAQALGKTNSQIVQLGLSLVAREYQLHERMATVISQFANPAEFARKENQS
jgi:hypothetical protein